MRHNLGLSLALPLEINLQSLICPCLFEISGGEPPDFVNFRPRLSAT